MKTIAPQTRAPRTALRTSYSRVSDRTSIGISHWPFPELTAEERCTVLGQIAQFFRDLAEQAEEERLTIAQEELSA